MQQQQPTNPRMYQPQWEERLNAMLNAPRTLRELETDTTLCQFLKSLSHVLQDVDLLQSSLDMPWWKVVHLINQERTSANLQPYLPKQAYRFLCMLTSIRVAENNISLIADENGMDCLVYDSFYATALRHGKSIVRATTAWVLTDYFDTVSGKTSIQHNIATPRTLRKQEPFLKQWTLPRDSFGRQPKSFKALNPKTHPTLFLVAQLLFGLLECDVTHCGFVDVVPRDLDIELERWFGSKSLPAAHANQLLYHITTMESPSWFVFNQKEETISLNLETYSQTHLELNRAKDPFLYAHLSPEDQVLGVILISLFPHNLIGFWTTGAKPVDSVLDLINTTHSRLPNVTKAVFINAVKKIADNYTLVDFDASRGVIEIKSADYSTPDAPTGVRLRFIRIVILELLLVYATENLNRYHVVDLLRICEEKRLREQASENVEEGDQSSFTLVEIVLACTTLATQACITFDSGYVYIYTPQEAQWKEVGDVKDLDDPAMTNKEVSDDAHMEGDTSGFVSGDDGAGNVVGGAQTSIDSSTQGTSEPTHISPNMMRTDESAEMDSAGAAGSADLRSDSSFLQKSEATDNADITSNSLTTTADDISQHLPHSTPLSYTAPPENPSASHTESGVNTQPHVAQQRQRGWLGKLFKGSASFVRNISFRPKCILSKH